jgi:DNA-3-methyladenine glycosylase
LKILCWKPSFLKSFSPLPSSFYERPAPQVARDLLGKGLYVSYKKKHFLCQIIEVEAYLGGEDSASHAFKGPTPRNQSMFLLGGHCYVYLSYGLNYCMNVVTDAENKGSAVLIRAAVPLMGLGEMAKNRRISDALTPKHIRSLLSGPGKLTQALGINKNFDGLRFDQSTFKIVDLHYTVPKNKLGVSPRIGISKAKSKKLRFFIKNSEFLSR